jgi:hypothetical protein
VQSAGNFVGVVVEFSAGMQLGENDFRRRLAFSMHFRRDAAAIVGDRYGTVVVDADVNFGAISRERFVTGVVDNFVDQVMKAIDTRGADVHRRTFSNSLEAL